MKMVKNYLIPKHICTATASKHVNKILRHSYVGYARIMKTMPPVCAHFLYLNIVVKFAAVLNRSLISLHVHRVNCKCKERCSVFEMFADLSIGLPLCA